MRGKAKIYMNKPISIKVSESNKNKRKYSSSTDESASSDKEEDDEDITSESDSENLQPTEKWSAKRQSQKPTKNIGYIKHHILLYQLDQMNIK
jgi:hypothetical protein